MRQLLAGSPQERWHLDPNPLSSLQQNSIRFDHKLGPWPDMETARSFLRYLAGMEAFFKFDAPGLDYETCASWLIAHGIGPLAFARCRDGCPQLASYLQTDAFSAAAENSMHWQNLQQMHNGLADASISVVLLKGAALAQTVYGGRDRRTMSDIDLWLRKEDFPAAMQIMRRLGFYTVEKEERPAAFQLAADGEIQFSRKGWQRSLAEFHVSPYAGWWLKRTASIDNDAIWSSKEALNGLPSLYQLSPEDTILHVAVHLTINHQCGFWAIRSLMDLALTIDQRFVDWQIVAQKAKQFRIANAVWLALNLLYRLFSIEALEPVLNNLCPARWRRRYLSSLVSPESVILGADLRSGRLRFLFLLLLVDRKRDMVHLVLRTLWPEKSWLFYRYGTPVNHWQHLNRILRQGQL